jgi:hypothetical protein
MSELTADERMRFAAMRAREEAAELAMWDKHQPFFPLGFSIGYRNPGHWDIFADQVPGKDDAWLMAHGEGASINGRTVDKVDPDRPSRGRERAFRIRGEPGAVWVADERWNPRRERGKSLDFRSVTAAMLWIIEELMQEPTAPGADREEAL